MLKFIAKLIARYLLVGIAILLIQVALVETIAPACDGKSVQALWEPNKVCTAIETRVGICLNGRSHIASFIVKQVVMWLPDLIDVFQDKETTVHQYFLGNPRCEAISTLPPATPEPAPQSTPLEVNPIIERPITPAVPPTPEPQSTPQNVPAPSIEAPAPEQQEAVPPPPDVQQSQVLLEPFQNVTLELPSNWTNFDQNSVEQAARTAGLPAGFEMKIFVPSTEKAAEAQVTLMIAPPTFPPDQAIGKLSPEQMKALELAWEKGILGRMTSQGYRLTATSPLKSDFGSNRVTLRKAFSMVGANNESIEVENVAVMLKTRSVELALTNQHDAPETVQEAIAHAKDTFVVIK